MRRHENWLDAFVRYGSYSEALPSVYFWVGVSTIAGALQRKVWIDEKYFKWTPNFFILIVAPAGVARKSTTLGVGMKLLNKVPGIHMGPDIVTWQALLDSLEEAKEDFSIGEGIMGEQHSMSAITVAASELGNFFDPTNREYVDALVNLWDGKEGILRKRTRTQHNNDIPNPWVNLIGCTTPSWIAGTFPDYLVGGGFSSRCVFVYADRKARSIAYPHLEIPAAFDEMENDLLYDLEQIAMLKGEFRITDEALAWGKAWYDEHGAMTNGSQLNTAQFSGYLDRKQTHVHKLAMVLSAAKRDDLIIDKEDLEHAYLLMTALESSMPKVFSHIGKDTAARAVDRLVAFVMLNGKVDQNQVMRHMITTMGSARDLQDIIKSAVDSGMVIMKPDGGKYYFFPGVI